LILLLAFWWSAVPAFASGSVHATVAMQLLRPGLAAVADLDGDHIPDLASSISTGRTSQGYSYRVDLDFGGNPGRKTLSVFSDDSAGLDIEAIDVDGDHDLDLVISGRLSRPVSVWLNDGRGRFTQVDSANYPLSLRRTRSAVQSPETASPVLMHFEWRRPHMAGSRQRIDCRPLHFLFGEVLFSSSGFSRISVGSARLRAPPFPII
jgi:hypothetical protein